MKKERRSESRAQTHKSGTQKGHEAFENAEQSPNTVASDLDREIETILDPSWAWKMLHKR